MKPAACKCATSGEHCIPCLGRRARLSRQIAANPDPGRDARLHELEQKIAEDDERILETRLAAEQKPGRAA